MAAFLGVAAWGVAGMFFVGLGRAAALGDAKMTVDLGEAPAPAAPPRAAAPHARASSTAPAVRRPERTTVSVVFPSEHFDGRPCPPPTAGLLAALDAARAEAQARLGTDFPAAARRESTLPV